MVFAGDLDNFKFFGEEYGGSEGGGENGLSANLGLGMSERVFNPLGFG
jgi:hypothetical protein